MDHDPGAPGFRITRFVGVGDFDSNRPPQRPAALARRGVERVEADRAVRWTDTRLLGTKVEGGSVTQFDTTVEGFARSDGVVVNVTAVNTEAPGFITVYPCGDERPTTSMLNTAPGLVVSNAAIAAPSTDQLLCVYSLTTTDLVVDMMGSVDESFDPLVPIRVLDTRG